MSKNDRPTTYYNGKPRYYNIANVPPYYASKAEWNRRGYKIPKDASWSGTVEHWNGRNYIRYDLFHLSQCQKIRTENAKSRRFSWYRSLKDEGAKEVSK